MGYSDDPKPLKMTTQDLNINHKPFIPKNSEIMPEPMTQAMPRPIPQVMHQPMPVVMPMHMMPIIPIMPQKKQKQPQQPKPKLIPKNGQTADFMTVFTHE